MRRSLAVILLSACATTTPPPEPQGGPRGLRATDHLQAARQHEHDAERTIAWPEGTAPGPGDAANGPWYRDTAEHERLAGIHRAKAAELNAEFADWCANLPSAEISVSPLKRYGLGGGNTPKGAVVYLAANAGPPQRLLMVMKCHRAWMMLAPADMDDCPLDLPGLRIAASGDVDGITVSLAVTDPKLVPELQRRVAKELESASTLGQAPR